MVGGAALAADHGRPAAATSSTGSGSGWTRGRTRSATASTRSRACSRSGVGGLFGTGLGQSRVVRPERVQRLHLRRDRPGVRADRGGRRDRAVPGPGLLWRPGRAGGAGHVRGAAGGRHHRLAVPPGVHQHRGGRGAPPDHRDHAAVHQRRRLVAHHQLRGGRDPAVDLARDRRKGDVERRCDC